MHRVAPICLSSAIHFISCHHRAFPLPSSFVRRSYSVQNKRLALLNDREKYHGETAMPRE